MKASKLLMPHFFVCLFIGGLSGRQKPDKQLRIGDELKNMTFNVVHNYKNDSISLSDFGGKSIVLDFWNRYCSSCIASFPVLQKLQEQFNDSIQILLVTYNTKDEVKSLFKNSPIVKATTLPMIFGDTILKRLFPHTSEPYQIWLNTENVVKASTDGFAATPKNIRDLIQGNPLDVPFRNDLLNVELNKSLLLQNKGRNLEHLLYYAKLRQSTPNESDLGSRQAILVEDDSRKIQYFSYYSMIMGNLQDLNRAGSASLTDAVSGKTVGMQLYNIPMLGLYSEAYNATFGTKIIIEGENVDDYFPPKDPLKNYAWRRRNVFCYEAVLPDYSLENFHEVMKMDLRRFFLISAKWEERSIPCLIIKSNNSKEKLVTKGGEPIFEKMKKGYILKNTMFRAFILYFTLANERMSDPFIIDETGIFSEKRVDMIIESDLRDIPALNKELMKYGLSIEREIRNIKVLVLVKNENYKFLKI